MKKLFFTALLMLLIGWSQAQSNELESVRKDQDASTENSGIKQEHETEKKKIPFLWHDRPIRDHSNRL